MRFFGATGRIRTSGLPGRRTTTSPYRPTLKREFCWFCTVASTKQENACWWLSQRAFRCFTVRLHSSSQMVVKECKIKRNRVPLFPVYDPCFSILLFSYINPFIMFNSKNACAFNCHVHAKISQRVCPTFPTISIDILSEIYIESKFLHHQSVAYSACKF